MCPAAGNWPPCAVDGRMTIGVVWCPSGNSEAIHCADTGAFRPIAARVDAAETLFIVGLSCWLALSAASLLGAVATRDEVIIIAPPQHERDSTAVQRAAIRMCTTKIPFQNCVLGLARQRSNNNCWRLAHAVKSSGRRHRLTSCWGGRGVECDEGFI